jgi:hypothetical protein
MNTDKEMTPVPIWTEKEKAEHGYQFYIRRDGQLENSIYKIIDFQCEKLIYLSGGMTGLSLIFLGLFGKQEVFGLNLLIASLICLALVILLVLLAREFEKSGNRKERAELKSEQLKKPVSTNYRRDYLLGKHLMRFAGIAFFVGTVFYSYFVFDNLI